MFLAIRHAIHLERVVQFKDCGAGGVGCGEGNPRGCFQGVVARIELSIDHVARDVDRRPLRGGEVRASHHQQQRQGQDFGVETKLHRSHSTGHGETKADCNRGCGAAGISCNAIRAACSIAVCFVPPLLLTLSNAPTVRKSDCIVARASSFSSRGRSCSATFDAVKSCWISSGTIRRPAIRLTMPTWATRMTLCATAYVMRETR